MQKFFKALGDTVLARWKQSNFSLEQFPEIACRAMNENSPAKKIKLAALMRDFLLSEDQSPQTDSPFGEPELVVYSNPRFYIQLLFWMDGTTAIHQHEFSGAFHVMHGSSIHAHYEFENATAVTPYLRMGNLKMKSMEVLPAGRTVPIISGHKTIHSLFHLDSPSVTVVVRTQHDPGTGPQLNYLPPHLAVDPHHVDLLTLRRKQLLDVLEQNEDPSYTPLVMDMLSDLDFERGFHILQHAMGYLQRLDNWALAIATFKKKHGPLAAGVEPTLLEESRRSLIKAMRSTILDPEHRFFLALLMNAPTRADLLKLVVQRHPKISPVATIVRWAEGLLEVSDEGVSLLDANFPEIVQVDPDAQPAMFLAAFEHFLKGDKKPPTILKHLSKLDLDEFKTVFAGSVLKVLIA